MLTTSRFGLMSTNGFLEKEDILRIQAAENARAEEVK